MTTIASLLERPVSDAEIEAAARCLNLPPRAFHGEEGGDPRAEVLRSNQSIDIAACPGSGKTTLLVAKLAILAGRWRSASQGICVLSHTNVARIEIEARLGTDPVARTILSYPHFVGTIHGFVNQFVALPWLRSLAIDVVAIDDEICLRRRWHQLSPGQRDVVAKTGRDAELLRIVDADHNLGDIRWGGGILNKDKALYKAFVEACRTTTSDGYFCHEDMMLWAAQALDRNPALRQSVRHRFPVLFLDEVQDNSESQSTVLRRIFMEGDGPVVRQRFGDMNQAIYGRASDTTGANCDPFPDANIMVTVPNSHRFGEQIAVVANPLALTPPGLIGLRAHDVGVEARQAALLLFDVARAASVLPAFAGLLVERFSEAERAGGTFAAIGAIHRDTGRDNPPNCVAHYWSSYDQQLMRSEAKPDKLIGYLRRGVAEALPTGDMRPIVERCADGLIRLASVLNPSVRHPNFANRHRQLIMLLAEKPEVTKRYHVLTWLLATGRLPAAQPQWERWRQPVIDIASALLAGARADDAGEFLEWEEDRQVAGEPARYGNVFAYPPIDPTVRIKVGSIHSVKGETHLATLVLDTHFRGSHLGRIKDWLTGVKSGLAPGKRNGDVRTSLKQHYVAVTRPSHLLCVAMRNDAITDAELDLMRARRWRIGDVADDGIAWRG